MVKRSKQSRRQSRRSKQSRRQSRRSKQSRRQSRRTQRGGMAPFEYTNGLLLDQATRVQAEVAGLDGYIADSQVLAKQAGGRRRSQRRGRGRKQRGGSNLAEFNSSYELLPASVARGVNPQFMTEGSVNALYHPTKGAQGL